MLENCTIPFVDMLMCHFRAVLAQAQPKCGPGHVARHAEILSMTWPSRSNSCHPIPAKVFRVVPYFGPC